MTHELEGLDLIPEHCREGMQRYIDDGVRPGRFLTAVLSNNLFQTFLRAEDSFNREQLYNYIFFLTQHAPPNCFGSRAKVEAWIEDAAERRAMANIAGAQP